MRAYLRVIVLLLLVALVASTTTLVIFYTDWLWFKDLGFSSVFLKMLWARLVVGAAFGSFFWLAVLSNVYIARSMAPKMFYLSPRLDFRAIMQQVRPVVERLFHPLAIIVSFFLALSVGITASGSFMTWLQYLNHVQSKIRDPLFGRALDFYFYELPAYSHLQRFLGYTVFIAILFSLAVHFLEGSIVPGRGRETFAPHVKAHISVLGALLLLDLAWFWWLARYQLLYSARGVAFGASYTDVNAEMPALALLAALAIASAVILLINVRFRGWRLPIASVGLLAAGWILVGNLYPAAVQAYSVTPNEIVKETPYIKLGIQNTLKAYDLEGLPSREFPAVETLDERVLEANKATTDNVRLWDWRPLKRTYSQLQEIRLYYTFNDVDYDRYILDGSYRQVALSAREMNASQLPESAQTWINQHLVFTHGYGAVMSPVNEVTAEGLPRLFIKDIPPVSTTDLKITTPQIYFGEKTDDYVIVRTKTKEFDYPRGQANRYTKYREANGIKMSSFWRKAAFAYRFATIKMLLSDAITSDSSLFFDRDITTRLRKAAPFLEYDPDPYLTIVDGKLLWIVDAFTMTDKYPYSKPFNGRDNYIRNSVKVTIDAYDGTTKFYLIDPSDPLAATYAKLFPKLFTKASAMPKSVVKHLRYPESLFKVQADIYRTFHMKDPQVFYNKEDQWDIPTELSEDGAEEVAPYYSIMKLPGEKDEEFLLLQPFTPANKNNMISWIAARSDSPNYGKLQVFDFPKDRLVFGPRQIEARIDQDADISRQLTLWNQRGSSVIRGNLLVIPVNESILYVEPIYLEAEQSQLPELKRVIVAFGGRISMGTSFANAVEELFRGVEAPKETEGKKAIDTIKSLSATAARLYDAATEALKNGDFTEYGKQIKELGTTLDRLREMAEE